MKIKMLFGCCCSILLLTSCNSKNAFKYSEEIVRKEQSLIPLINVTEDKAGRYIETEKFDSVAVVAQTMENAVQVQIKAIEDFPAPDVPEGENFKAASIRYFEYLKSVYTSYRRYGQSTTAREREMARTSMQLLIGQKNLAVSSMQLAQKKYAEANHFRINN